MEYENYNFLGISQIKESRYCVNGNRRKLERGGRVIMLRKGIIFFLITLSIYAGNIPTIKPFKVDDNFKRKFLTYEEYIEGYNIYIKPKEKRTELERKKLEEYEKEFRYSEKMDETEFYQIIPESSRGDSQVDEYWYNPYKIITSSNLQPYKGIKYDEDNLYDNNLKTAWIEGKTGDGMGESIEYILNTQVSQYNFIPNPLKQLGKLSKK